MIKAKKANTKESNKVTVGFKCSPTLRNKLIDEAEKKGLTLSEFLELRNSKDSDIKQVTNDETKQKKSELDAANKKILELEKEIQNISKKQTVENSGIDKAKLTDLQKQLDFYESNQVLKKIVAKYEKSGADFENSEGVTEIYTIKGVKDAFTLLTKIIEF